jgi:hypothetical protein
MSSLQQNWRREEQVLPGSEEGVGERKKVGDSEEKWPIQCMHR